MCGYRSDITFTVRGYHCPEMSVPNNPVDRRPGRAQGANMNTASVPQATAHCVVAASALAVALTLAGCQALASSRPDPVPGTAATDTAVESPTISPPASDSEGSPSTSAPAITSDIIGYWHRPQTCAELLTAFEAAGLAQSHIGWAQGNFYSGEKGPTTGDPCAGAEGPLEHSHWFTETGEFGSHDQARQQVDYGDYTLVDSDTLSFPSHSTEFGFEGDILVDFRIDSGGATFEVTIPQTCDSACQDAHAWALSAFASGAWTAGDVP
jgi:hypothetical protein